MNVIEAIYSRRAVRSYTRTLVGEVDIHNILRAAVQAPSAMNRQPWLFSVIEDEETLQSYSERAKTLVLGQLANDPKAAYYQDLLRSPEFNIFYGATTLVVIGVAQRGPYSDADCWLAAENLMLSAWQAGLGTCAIGFAVPLLNQPDIRAEIGLPGTGVAVAPIVVGHPDAVPSPVERAEPKVVTWKHPHHRGNQM